jgi:hypothetical protein
VKLGRAPRGWQVPAFERPRREVACELRRLRLESGGCGVFIICATRRLILSSLACHALIRAAGRLGFPPTWAGVTRALAQWALPDVISEAIEEQES